MKAITGLLASAALAAALLGINADLSHAAGRGFGSGGAGAFHGGRGGFGRKSLVERRGAAGRQGDGSRFARGGVYGRFGAGFFGFGFGNYGFYDPFGDIYGRSSVGRSGDIADWSPAQPLGPPTMLGVRDAPVLPPAIYVLGGKAHSSSAGGTGGRKGVDAETTTRFPLVVAVR